jgi:hypothetical protein
MLSCSQGIATDGALGQASTLDAAVSDGMSADGDTNLARFDFGPTEAQFAEYRFTWNRDGITDLENGEWQTTTNLGYEVVVKQGWIVDYSATFVPCRSATRRSNSPSSKFIEFIGTWVISDAFAGHDDIADPSAMSDGLVEAIGGRPVRVRVGPIPSATYCDIHYLVARGDAITIPLEGAPNMVGASVVLEGTYRLNGHTEIHPFAISSAIARGTLHTEQEGESQYFEGNAATVDEDEGIGVHFIRPMKSLFDDIQFEEFQHDSIARILLKNLVLKTRFLRYP